MIDRLILVRQVLQHGLLATKIPMACLMFAALLIPSPQQFSGDSGELDQTCYCNSVTKNMKMAVESWYRTNWSETPTDVPQERSGTAFMVDVALVSHVRSVWVARGMPFIYRPKVHIGDFVADGLMMPRFPVRAP